MKSFTDNSIGVEEDRTCYRNFENVTKPVDEILVEEFNENMREVDVLERLDVCTENEVQETIGAGLFVKLFDNKDRFKLGLDNQKFNLKCMEINDILTNFSYFLRVYELKNNLDT